MLRTCFTVVISLCHFFVAIVHGDLTTTPDKKMLIQSLNDEIGAGNFTYFRLKRSGCLRIELRSISGDVDIYASTEIPQPDYENYDMKSETCGLDVITIPSSMSRPVFISLFGHPNYLLSQFELFVYEVEDIEEDDYETLVNKFERYYYDVLDDQHNSDGSSSKPPHSSSYDETNRRDRTEDDVPLWWKIVLGFIEFGLEVIL